MNDGPKLTLAVSDLEDATLRRVKQLGVDHVIMGGGPLPWTEKEIRSRMDRLATAGLKLGNMMIFGFPNAVYGRPKRDEDIEKVRQSVRAAGKSGLPVVEYNFYAHRIVEGYAEELGRGGSALTAFDNDRAKGLPPLPEEGTHTLDEMWANITYFLKAVIPVATPPPIKTAGLLEDDPSNIVLIFRTLGRQFVKHQIFRLTHPHLNTFHDVARRPLNRGILIGELPKDHVHPHPLGRLQRQHPRLMEKRDGLRSS